MRTVATISLVAFMIVLTLGFMVFAPGGVSAGEAVAARMQAENDLMHEKLHSMKDAEVWMSVDTELGSCASEQRAVILAETGAGGCGDFADKIHRLRTPENPPLMQREGAIDLLVAHHMYVPSPLRHPVLGMTLTLMCALTFLMPLSAHRFQLSMRTDRGTLGSNPRKVHKAGIRESATALTKVLLSAEGR